MTDGEDEKFRDLTWQDVERHGIPPSPVRDALFAIADLLDSKPGGDLLALASGVYRAIQKEVFEHYKPRSALEIQIETLRLQRELSAMLKTEFPPVTFTSADFEATPATPAELGESLGYDDQGRAVRNVLRRGFPHHELHTRWSPLTDEQINYVRAHLATKK